MHTCVQRFDTEKFHLEVEDNGRHSQGAIKGSKVENVGIDPTTSHMQSKRSTI